MSFRKKKKRNTRRPDVVWSLSSYWGTEFVYKDCYGWIKKKDIEDSKYKAGLVFTTSDKLKKALKNLPKKGWFEIKQIRLYNHLVFFKMIQKNRLRVKRSEEKIWYIKDGRRVREEYYLRSK